MLNFIRAYGTTKVQSAVQDATAALVAFDPEGATDAQIQLMTEHLDELAHKIARYETQLASSSNALKAAQALNNKRLAVAELLSKDVEAVPDASKSASLERQLATIEEAQPEIDDLKSQVSDASNTLTALRSAHTDAANKLKAARGQLESAHRAMDRAEAQRQQAKDSEEAAKIAAGVARGNDNLNIALSALDRKTQALKEETEAAKLNAATLAPVDHETDDPNIVAATARVNGTVDIHTQSPAERIAALKNR